MNQAMVRRAFPGFGLVLVLILGAVSSAKADTIYFRNGDRLTGEITGFKDNRILLTSSTGLELGVDPPAIWTMRTEGLVVLVFADGRILTTQLQPSGDGTVESLDGETISIMAIRDINPPPEVPAWRGSFSFGASMARGNTDTTQTTGNAEISRRSSIDRVILNAGYASGRQRDAETGDVSTTEKNYFGSLQYDFFLSRRLYTWTRARGEADEIAALDLRLLAGAGFGYQWVERYDWTLSTEAGLTWSREDYASSDDLEQWTARIAWRYRRSYFDDWIRFFNDIEWYPSLEDNRDHFVVGNAGLQAPLTGSLAAEFRVEGTWDSTPARGAERTDVLYSLGLNLTF